MTAVFVVLRRILGPIALPASGLAILLLAILLGAARMDARHWHKQAENEAGLRQRDRDEMVKATFQATYDALINVYRVEAARRKIDERTIDALQADRRAADAGFDRLRASAAAHLRAPGQADLSAEREATCRAVANAGCDEIPALLKAAQDNTDQLLRLIDWASAQGEITTAPPPEQAEALPR